MAERPHSNVRQAVPFFVVRDMAASLAFYGAGLGFQMAQAWTPERSDRIRWCWLQLGEAALMLQEGEPAATPHGLGVTIYFICDDALSIDREASSRGLEPRRPFVGNGQWVVGFVDPDGYQVEFESPTDVAEEVDYDPRLHGR